MTEVDYAKAAYESYRKQAGPPGAAFYRLPHARAAASQA